jgi:hypothetical protein
MTKWLIYSKQESLVQEEPMFWSDSIGWVDITDASEYDDAERYRDQYMPIPDGVWIEKNQALVTLFP